MTTEDYNLYTLRHTILDDKLHALDPITMVEARKLLDNWFEGFMSEEMTVRKLVKLNVLTPEKCRGAERKVLQ
jgi:hypothetical protein